MSTQNEITRLQTARNKLRTKGVELGINTNTDKLDVIATAYEGIENRGAVSAQVQEGDTYTIPKGYHNGSGTVSGVKGGGNYSLQSKKATPTKKQQNITPDSGYYGLSDVTVDPIPDNFQDVSPVTAGAADVLANKVIVSATGETIAGTMPNNGKVTPAALAAGGSYTIPKGYHNGEGKVTAQDLASQTEADAVAKNILEGKTAWVDGEKVTGTMPDINTALGGTIDYSLGEVDPESFTTKDGPTGPMFVEPRLYIPEGYHNGKTYVSTPAYIMEDRVSVTPKKESQTLYKNTQVGNAYVFSHWGTVDIEPIPDEYQDVTGVTAGAEDVLAGKVIVDAEGNEVTGTMPNIGAQNASVNAGGSVTISKGYHDGTGKVTAASLASQTPGDAAAANILTGKKAWVAGSQVTGTMPNNGAKSLTIDGLTTTSVTIPAGYHNGSGTVSLTSDIEEALAAI